MDAQSFFETLADAFNTTALGLGVIAGAYLLLEGYYFRAAFIFFVMVPVYFILHDHFVSDE